MPESSMMQKGLMPLFILMGTLFIFTLITLLVLGILYGTPTEKTVDKTPSKAISSVESKTLSDSKDQNTQKELHGVFERLNPPVNWSLGKKYSTEYYANY